MVLDERRLCIAKEDGMGQRKPSQRKFRHSNCDATLFLGPGLDNLIARMIHSALTSRYHLIAHSGPRSQAAQCTTSG